MFTRVTTDLRQAITCAREAATLAEPGDLRTRGYAQWVVATTCRDVGTLNEALTTYEQGEALFLAQDLPRDLAGLVVPIHASLCSWRAETLALLGHFREALAAGKEGVRIASTISHSQTLSMGRSLLGHVYLLRGDPESAVPVFESGLLGAEEDGVIVGIIANAVGLAAALALTGDTDRAADFLTRAEQARPAGARELPVRLTKYRAMTGTVFLAMKRFDEALAVLGGGLELAEAHGARGYRASLLRLRGEAQTEIGLHEAAIQSLHEGLILATNIGQRAEMVRCRLGLGRVYRARNEPSRAKEYLEQAAAIARDVDMPRELLRIAREISSL